MEYLEKIEATTLQNSFAPIINQNAIRLDDIRGALWLPKLLEVGCHSAEFDSIFQVGRRLLVK